MPIRQARHSDLSAINAIVPLAFSNKSLFQTLFPYRDEHPVDYYRAFRHSLRESWWNYRRTIFVSCDVDCNGNDDEHEHEHGKKGEVKEVVKSVIVLTRHGDGWQRIWGIKSSWDPRLLIRPILAYIHQIHRYFFPNRASIQPTPSDPEPLTYWTFGAAVAPFTMKYFTPPSLVAVATGQSNKNVPEASSDNSTDSTTLNPLSPPLSSAAPQFWEISTLTTLPSSHGRGHGRALVEHALSLARTEWLPCMVIATEFSERFYQRCGLVNLVGYATDGEGNPTAAWGIGGGAILWSEYGPGEAERRVKDVDE